MTLGSINARLSGLVRLSAVTVVCAGLTASLAFVASPVLADEAPAKGATADAPAKGAKKQAAKKEKAKKAPPSANPAAPGTAEPADKPAIKMQNDQGAAFLKRHEGFLNDLKAMNGDVGVVFLGDSITDGWRSKAADTFQKAFGQYRPLNLGIGGDRTQHVLWRIENGEIEGIKPKAAVLMIGTNNIPAGNTDDEIAAGVTRIVETLHQKLPQTKVLLLAVFPRGMEADSPFRARIAGINERLKKLDNGKTVKYLDIGQKFLEPDGTLPASIMPDALHPNDKGYEIWAEAITPALKEMMK